MEGVWCANCAQGTASLKGVRLSHIPPVLTFSLSRFEIDYSNMQRKKINDRFAYPLELSLADFLDAECDATPDDAVYELKAVLIHRGGAYGGHYHAYVR